MILGMLWMAAANGAAVLGACALLPKVRTGQAPLDTVLFLLLRLLIVSTVTLLAGLLGFLNSTAIGVLSVMAIAVILITPARGHLLLPSLPRIGIANAIFASIVLARLLAQCWFFAPYSGDVLSYHLPKVAEWIRAGSFTREMGVDSHVSFPAGFELVEAWWVVFLRHDVLIEMAGVEFLALAFCATYALAKHCQLSDDWAFFAAACYALVPGLHLQATACVNDAPIAALFVSAAALVSNRAPLSFVLIAAGLGLGVKPTFLYVAPGCLVLWTLLRKRPLLCRSSGGAWVLAGLACAVGVYWYVRNWVWYGNPIYPVGSHGLPGPHPIQFGARASSLGGSLGSLLDRRLYDEGPYGPFLTGISGWGPVAFSIGMASIVVAIQRLPELKNLFVSFGVSLICVLLLVLADPWNMRFTLFFPSVLCIGAAWLASQSRLALVTGGAALAYCFLATTLPDQLPARTFERLAYERWTERSLAMAVDSWTQESAIGYFADNRNNAYLLYRPDFSCRVVYLRATTVDGLMSEVNEAGVRLIYAVPAKREAHAIIEECVSRRFLRKLGRHFYEVH